VPHGPGTLSRLAAPVRAPDYFLETFIDPGRFVGTCYKAANWIGLGETTGRAKDDMHHLANRPVKQVLGYPLAKDFRQRLCHIGT